VFPRDWVPVALMLGSTSRCGSCRWRHASSAVWWSSTAPVDVLCLASGKGKVEPFATGVPQVARQRREMTGTAVADLTPSNVLMLETELGEEFRHSLDRLKRRCARAKDAGVGIHNARLFCFLKQEIRKEASAGDGLRRWSLRQSLSGLMQSLEATHCWNEWDAPGPI
jgi:hypothetical protein